MARPSDVIILAKLDSIEQKVNVIWLELQKMQELASAQVIPELERAINRVWVRAKRIDLKVPDK